ncbi:MAG: tRNA pseudouridine(38-40) synthase TruA [Proteobacteria bacterium]|nr:tRNA pseudouridine(38-40) synthase TruA [Pseudomonadota bacterium]
MPRFFLTLEYDGSDFVGWQRQSNGTSVQGCLEEAAQAITGEAVAVLAAGRTDAGVHALGQVAHADLPSRFTTTQLPLALNAHLPPTIRIITARQVPDEAHARFSATMRSYRYRILNRRIAPALLRGRVWHLSSPLDDKAMHTAAQHLIGTHDFTSFRSLACQAKSPIRTLNKLSVSRQGDEVMVDAEALSFLHNQVRIMVGSLVLVAQNKWQPEDMARVLVAKDRSKAGATAPPHGLYFVGVAYPSSI